MKQFIYTLLSIAFLLLFTNPHLRAQDTAGLYNKIVYFPDRLFTKLTARSNQIKSRLAGQSAKYLKHIAREEKRLHKKLSLIDAIAAQRIFGDAQTKYKALEHGVKNKGGKIPHLRERYLPHLDSIKTAFSLLSKTDGLFENRPGTRQLIKKSLSDISALEDTFTQAEEMQRYLIQRRQFLEDQLGVFGMTRDLGKLKQRVYYYQSQVEEYKKAFENHSLLESKALAVLQKTSVFKKFFREHSQLSGLFRLPEVPGTPIIPDAGFALYQTRLGLDQQLLQRFGAIPDVHQMADGPVLNTANPIAQVRERLSKIGSAKNNNIEMPDFRPNHQKTKSFTDRLEFGANLQSVKSNRFFPSTSDIAVSVGYKLNDKSIIGIGTSYKMGWGQHIRNITITSEGIGLRSYIDYKIRGGFWLSGGAEMNYRSRFRSFEILNNYEPWQKSALLGLSKKYRAGKRFRGNMQLFYDFFYRQQVPRTPPVLFRVGYTL